MSQTLQPERYNEDGVGGMHVYSPWWLDTQETDFPEAYQATTVNTRACLRHRLHCSAFRLKSLGT